MKTKKFLSLFITGVLCLSPFRVFAQDGLTEEIPAEASPYDEYVDYSDMYYRLHRNNGDDKPADLSLVRPTVDMDKAGNINVDITDEKYADRIDVYYNDDIIDFDVEPIIESGRTLVPLRAIFEAMGCAVYYSEEDEKQTVTARRANDNLILTIGEDKMHYGGEEIALDVPAKIKDGRTLVPLRAISEVFECEVIWDGETKTIYIYSPANAYVVSTEKLSERVSDYESKME